MLKKTINRLTPFQRQARELFSRIRWPYKILIYIFFSSAAVAGLTLIGRAIQINYPSDQEPELALTNTTTALNCRESMNLLLDSYTLNPLAFQGVTLVDQNVLKAYLDPDPQDPDQTLKEFYRLAEICGIAPADLANLLYEISTLNNETINADTTDELWEIYRDFQ